ncbi:MAG: hypothetical protein OJF51_000732 [Nitrospira sp.]|jgi:hypothetical protein|nr:MAG: hypothetical protein OJF51_000732 [Nitrospira sp.]
MKSSWKMVGVVLCGVALSVGPSMTVQAEHSPSPSDTMKTDSLTDAQKYNFQSDDDKQQNVKDRKSSASGEKTIRGELFRVDDANYFVKTGDGAEVRLHTDKTTNMKGKIKKGDQIEATVNDQNHALLIQAIK